MTYHYLHHGGKPTNNDGNIYPQAKISRNDNLMQAAHKSPVAFANSRMLDFSPNGTQEALLQYVKDTKIEVDDKITLSAIPAKCLLIGFAWEVLEAEDGIQFDLATEYSGLSLGSLDVSTVGSGFVEVEDTWIKEGDYVTATVKAFPSTVPSKAKFSVSPIFFVPFIGN